MTIWRNLSIMFLACVLVAGLTVVLSGLDGAQVTGTSRTVEDIDYTTISGESGTLHTHRGKPVVVHFWATWCPPCLEELPALVEKAGETPGTQFLLISVDKNPQIVTNFMASYTLSGNVLSIIDSDMRIARAFNVRMFPESFILDAQMGIRHHLAGPVNWKTYPLPQ